MITLQWQALLSSECMGKALRPRFIGDPAINPVGFTWPHRGPHEQLQQWQV